MDVFALIVSGHTAWVWAVSVYACFQLFFFVY